MFTIYISIAWKFYLFSKSLQKPDAFQLGTEASSLTLVSFKELKSPEVHHCFISIVSICCSPPLDLYLISQQFCHRDLASSPVTVCLLSLKCLLMLKQHLIIWVQNCKKCKLMCTANQFLWSGAKSYILYHTHILFDLSALITEQCSQCGLPGDQALGGFKRICREAPWFFLFSPCLPKLTGSLYLLQINNIGS